MNEISLIGVDLAKNVFQVHGVDQAGRVVLRRQLRRSQVEMFFASLPACAIAIEACPSAHFWARSLASQSASEKGDSLRACGLIHGVSPPLTEDDTHAPPFAPPRVSE